ncbi:hypothetical protein [Draconibacterium orientale]|nr:hypothetical protein [Draconibacterium orientale]
MLNFDAGFNALVNQKIKNLENQLAVRQGHSDSGEEESSDTPADE